MLLAIGPGGVEWASVPPYWLPHEGQGGADRENLARTCNRGVASFPTPSFGLPFPLSAVVVLGGLLQEIGRNLCFQLRMRLGKPQNICPVFLPLAGAPILVQVGPQFALQNILQAGDPQAIS